MFGFQVDTWKAFELSSKILEKTLERKAKRINWNMYNVFITRKHKNKKGSNKSETIIVHLDSYILFWFLSIFLFFDFLDNKETHDYGHVTLCHRPRI